MKGKPFARLHDDGESLVLRATPEQRALLLASAPEVFCTTDHHRAHPWVLVRLPVVSATVLRASIEDAWRLRAPGKLVDDHDSRA